MSSSLFFIGFFWLLSLLINISNIISYKTLSGYTIFFFSYVSFFIISAAFIFCFIFNRNLNVNHFRVKISKKVFFDKVLNLIFFYFPFFLLIIAVLKSNMLITPFSEYFLLRRGGEIDGGGSVTGITYLDTLLKIYVYPAFFSLFLIQIAKVHLEDRFEVFKLFWIVIALLLFTYLFQVNYPVLFMIITFFFLFINRHNAHQSPIKKYKFKFFIFFMFFVILVFFSAANRFGSLDFFGIMLYYPLSYFSLGISIFDLNFKNEHSILHDHTYGLNLFGHLSLFIKYPFDLIGFPSSYFTPPSIENTTFLNAKVDVGGFESKFVNAFGTILFSFYRDFGVLGVILSPLIFLLMVLYTFFKNNLFSISCYYLLLFNGVSSLSVSPLDQPHFIFSLIFIFIITKEFSWKRF